MHYAMTGVAETLFKTIPVANEEFKETYLDDFRGQLLRRSIGELPPYRPPKTDNDNHTSSDESSDTEIASLLFYKLD
jgi:hypothetical protein